MPLVRNDTRIFHNEIYNNLHIIAPATTVTYKPSSISAKNTTPHIMNNGKQDLTHPDVVKLQQQLQDIKDQVRFPENYPELFFYQRIDFRRCVLCVWIDWKTWWAGGSIFYYGSSLNLLDFRFFYAVTEPVKCVEIAWMNVQFAERVSTSVFYSTTRLLKADQNIPEEQEFRLNSSLILICSTYGTLVVFFFTIVHGGYGTNFLYFGYKFCRWHYGDF